MGRFKCHKDSGSSDKRHTTVKGNVAHAVAHQVELLTLRAFSSCIRESELVRSSAVKEVLYMEGHDSNLAKDLSMIEG